MRQRTIGALLLTATLFLASFLPGQALESAGKRKVLDRLTPTYPSVARSMQIAGVVKVDVLVAADGTVRSLEIRGGHPLLAEAAATAVRKWKWEAAAHESHEMIEVRFSPAC